MAAKLTQKLPKLPNGVTPTRYTVDALSAGDAMAEAEAAAGGPKKAHAVFVDKIGYDSWQVDVYDRPWTESDEYRGEKSPVLRRIVGEEAEARKKAQKLRARLESYGEGVEEDII